MDFHISEAFLGIRAMAVSAGVKVLMNVLGTLRDLNTKIGIIIEQVKDHELRLRAIEVKKERK
jgi:hypothetical protein